MTVSNSLQVNWFWQIKRHTVAKSTVYSIKYVHSFYFISSYFILFLVVIPGTYLYLTSWFHINCVINFPTCQWNSAVGKLASSYPNKHNKAQTICLIFGMYWVSSTVAISRHSSVCTQYNVFFVFCDLLKNDYWINDKSKSSNMNIGFTLSNGNLFPSRYIFSNDNT